MSTGSGALVQRCRSFLTSSRNLKTGWLITAGIVALYVGAVHPHEYTGGIANSRALSLAARNTDPLALWQQGWSPQFSESRAQHVISSPAERVGTMAMLGAAVSFARESQDKADQDADAERKTVRTASTDLVVQKPADTVEKIRTLAEGLGGFLVESQISGPQNASSGSLTIRVPAYRFEQARAEIRKLGLHVESERVDARDVTRQYVDQEANLRNLRAEEAQYLAILKQARTVKDTLDVSEKLSGVRGQIDQQQAEFNALSKQIETAAITVSLQAEAEVRVFGLNWRPLYQVKVALREGLDGLANYASTMTAFVFLLPTILLWLATIIAGAAIGWRILRWAGRMAFGTKITVSSQA